MIDGDGVQRVLGPSVHDLEHRAAANVLLAEVVDDNVVNAPASSSLRRRSAALSSGAIARGHLNTAAGMGDVVYRTVTSVTWHRADRRSIRGWCAGFWESAECRSRSG